MSIFPSNEAPSAHSAHLTCPYTKGKTMKLLILAGCILTLLVSFSHATDWKLVWSDEFDSDGLPDPAKWGYEEGFIRNKEKQYYTRERKENVRIENGMLVIEGHKEEFKNPRYQKDSTNWKQQRKFAHYTSGSINTLGKTEFLYGRVEVRAKMPQGQGMWPAIWMLGTNITEVGWPRCGEIDIMEYVGHLPHTIHGTCHFTDPGNKEKSVPKRAGSGKITIQEPYNNFHLYAIEWDENQIKFFVDDQHYATLDIDEAGEGPDNPFRKPHYLLLNLALGGSWGGEIDNTVLPQQYMIDYVRVYETEKREEKKEE